MENMEKKICKPKQADFRLILPELDAFLELDGKRQCAWYSRYITQSVPQTQISKWPKLSYIAEGPVPYEERKEPAEAASANIEEVSGTTGMILARRNISDSVFTDLFRIPKYTLALYRALHPEDLEMTENQIRIVTLENILLNQPYNDLGFLAGERLLIFCEAQSTWSANILIRIFIYLAQTIQNYITETGQNLYGSKKVLFPEPEIYVIFTGERKDKPQRLVLSKEFFAGRQTAVKVRVKMLYGEGQGNIISQYVAFTRICKEQYRKYGRTRKAILEAIHICRNQNILKEYLENRKKEVVDIMMLLYDKDYIMWAHDEELRREATEEGRQEGRQEGLAEGRQEGVRMGHKQGALKKAKEIARNMEAMGFSQEKIAQALDTSPETVRQWLNENSLVCS